MPGATARPHKSSERNATRVPQRKKSAPPVASNSPAARPVRAAGAKMCTSAPPRSHSSAPATPIASAPDASPRSSRAHRKTRHEDLSSRARISPGHGFSRAEWCLAFGDSTPEVGRTAGAEINKTARVRCHPIASPGSSHHRDLAGSFPSLQDPQRNEKRITPPAAATGPKAPP